MIVLGLGSNTGDRLQNLRHAYYLLQKNPDFKIESVSPVYQSQAQLPNHVPLEWNRPYFNTAIRCSTMLKPTVALKALQTIEVNMGRDAQHAHWSPRVIDIDILFWSDYPSINTQELTLPHPFLFKRPFALWPLEDVVPEKIMVNLIDSTTGETAHAIAKSWGSKFAQQSAPFDTYQINHRIDTPYIMGIVNATPNSFSDGGKYLDPEPALQKSIELFNAGADILDIGAESTRPNNTDTLSTEAQWQRLKPILHDLNNYWRGKIFRPKISVDTRCPIVAEKALHFDVDFINDVTGFTNPLMLDVVKDSLVELVFMHHLSVPPRANETLPLLQDPIQVMKQWAMDRLQVFSDRNISHKRLIFDPGIGFGKTPHQNMEIIKRANELESIGLPILIAHSRKSFLKQFIDLPAARRDIETVILSNYLSQRNIHYLRVHHVDWAMRSFKVLKTLL